MREALLCAPVRTPIGKLRGGLQSVRPDDLAAIALAAAVARAKLPSDRIDEVFLGCANQAGEDNRNVARMATLLAGLPQSVSAVTVNRLCASGMEAIAQAARAVRLGEAEVVLAGGVESMTRAPWAMPKPDGAFPSGAMQAFDTSLGWRFPNPRLAAMFPLEQMGETAENVAAHHRISREDQDAFALASHRKACAAQEAGRFASELIRVELPQKKGPALVIERDEGPRADSSLEKLGKLGPAFRDEGTVTAGNSSTLNDGAAALVVASEAAARELGLPVFGRYVGYATHGVDPRMMGIGPVPATRKLMERTKRRLAELDVIELNEAFAAQSLACVRELDLDPEKVNPNGGAIALGHPLGCSGTRITVTLLHELARRGGKLGLASMCVGVGQGASLLVERL